MQKQTLILAIILSSILSLPIEEGWGGATINAQTYIPFPTDSAQWSVRHIYNNSQSANSLQYKMKGDTLLNGITYHKIYFSLDLAYNSPNQTLHCFVREDTTKKVFVKYPEGSGIDTSEFMLYNFNVAVGDTVTIRLLNFTTDSIYKLAVSNISPYPTLVDTRKYYKLQSVGPAFWSCAVFGLDWVEGMGAWFSPFYNEIPQWGCDSAGYEISCFWHKGNYVLGGTSCDYETGIGEINGSNYQSHVYPNPAQNSINFEVNFETKDLTNSYLIITDIVGQQMSKYNIAAKDFPVIINTEPYSNGIYFYSIYHNGVQKEAEKFIISK